MHFTRPLKTMNLYNYIIAFFVSQDEEKNTGPSPAEKKERVVFILGDDALIPI